MRPQGLPLDGRPKGPDLIIRCDRSRNFRKEEAYPFTSPHGGERESGLQSRLIQLKRPHILPDEANCTATERAADDHRETW